MEKPAQCSNDEWLTFDGGSHQGAFRGSAQLQIMRSIPELESDLLILPSRDRFDRWLGLAERETAALDSCVYCHGGGLSGKRREVRQNSLLRHRPAVAAGDYLHRAGAISSCADGRGIFSRLHFGDFDSRFSHRTPSWQV
jgi:hypothetical protein